MSHSNEDVVMYEADLDVVKILDNQANNGASNSQPKIDNEMESEALLSDFAETTMETSTAYTQLSQSITFVPLYKHLSFEEMRWVTQTQPSSCMQHGDDAQLSPRNGKSPVPRLSQYDIERNSPSFLGYENPEVPSRSGRSFLLELPLHVRHIIYNLVTCEHTRHTWRTAQHKVYSRPYHDQIGCQPECPLSTLSRLCSQLRREILPALAINFTPKPRDSGSLLLDLPKNVRDLVYGVASCEHVENLSKRDSRASGDCRKACLLPTLCSVSRQVREEVQPYFPLDPSKPPSFGRSPLLNLPPELRNNIYRFCLCEHVEAGSKKGHVCVHKHVCFCSCCEKSCRVPSIARASSHLRKEILPMFASTHAAWLTIKSGRKSRTWTLGQADDLIGGIRFVAVHLKSSYVKFLKVVVGDDQDDDVFSEFHKQKDMSRALQSGEWKTWKGTTHKLDVFLERDNEWFQNGKPLHDKLEASLQSRQARNLTREDLHSIVDALVISRSYDNY